MAIKGACRRIGKRCPGHFRGMAGREVPAEADEPEQDGVDHPPLHPTEVEPGERPPLEQEHTGQGEAQGDRAHDREDGPQRLGGHLGRQQHRQPSGHKGGVGEQRVLGVDVAREDPHAQHPEAQQAGRNGDRPAVQGLAGEPGGDKDHGPGRQHGGVEDGGRGLEDDARLAGAQVADLHSGVGGGGVEGLGGDDPQNDRGAGAEQQPTGCLVRRPSKGAPGSHLRLLSGVVSFLPDAMPGRGPGGEPLVLRVLGRTPLPADGHAEHPCPGRAPF